MTKPEIYLLIAAACALGCPQGERDALMCESTKDCQDGSVCLLDSCVIDDYFSEESLEGHPWPGGETNLTLDSNCFVLPLTTYQITGYHHGDPVGAGKFHAGDDVYGTAGTAAFASYGGTVRFAGNAGSWGGLIEIKHENPVDQSTFYTIYGHLRPVDLQVSEDDSVSTGQLIGYLGTMAENGGWPEHLHFSIFTGVHPASNVLKGHVSSLVGYEDPIPWLSANCDK